MFHWLCPECGHEIDPGAAECPHCEPAQGSQEPIQGSRERDRSEQAAPHAPEQAHQNRAHQDRAHPERAEPQQVQPEQVQNNQADCISSARRRENAVAAAEPEWELVPAGNADPADPGARRRERRRALESGSRQGPGQDSEQRDSEQRESAQRDSEPGNFENRMGRRPRRVPPQRKRASEQNMPGLQATPPSWQQPSTSGKKVWKAGVGFVDAAEAGPASLGGSDLSKNLVSRPARPPRRSPRAQGQRPPEQNYAQPVAVEEQNPVRRPALPVRNPKGVTAPAAAVPEPQPELASPVSVTPEAPAALQSAPSRFSAPEPVIPAPAVPQPPALGRTTVTPEIMVPPVVDPAGTTTSPDPDDMSALAAAVQDPAENRIGSDIAEAESDTALQTPEPETLQESADAGRSPQNARWAPAKWGATGAERPVQQARQEGELEPNDRLVATIPIPAHPVDSPPGPLYGLASVAAHIPAPVTLLRQPEMRRSSGPGVIGAVCDELLDDPCLRLPEPAPGPMISQDAWNTITPYLDQRGQTAAAVLETLPELGLRGGEPSAPGIGPEVLREVSRWLTRGLAPAPPQDEHLGLVPEQEIPPSNGPVLPMELASLEGAGMSAVLQETSPSRETPKGSPKLNGLVMVGVTMVCVGLSALVFGLRGDSPPAPPPAPTESVAAVADVPPPPPAADEPVPPVEVTGFRLVPGKGSNAEIHYLVVNHNGEAIDPVTVHVTLLSDRVAIPVAEFNFKAPALGPYQSREMVSPVEGLTDDIDAEVWRNLDAQVRLADPVDQAE